MKVRDLTEALADVDPDRMVVVPTATAKTARELVEAKEVTMDITEEGDFIPMHDPRASVANRTVLALVPEPKEKGK